MVNSFPFSRLWWSILWGALADMDRSSGPPGDKGPGLALWRLVGLLLPISGEQGQGFGRLDVIIG